MLGSVSPDLLTSALRPHGLEQGRVVSYEHQPIGAGQMASSHRIVPRYDTARPDAPVSLVAKLPSDDGTSRAMAAATGAYVREVGFYTDFAADIAVRTPRCFHASCAPDGLEFVLLLEDLSPADLVEQVGGARTDLVATAVGQAAALHASTWEDPRLTSVGWVPGAHIWRQLGSAIPHLGAGFAQRFGSRLDQRHLDVVTRLGEEIDTWCATLDEPTCLWHGDFRLDNLLFNARGGEVPLAVVDWQSCMSGPAAIDVSYLLGTSLDPADRRAAEAGLVRGYFDGLLAGGVEGYDWDSCWRDYRAHALFGLVLTVPVSLGVQQTERGDAMFATMAARVAEQVLDLDSFAALVELGSPAARVSG